MECDEDAFKRWQQFAYDVTLLAAQHPVNPKAMFPVCERLTFSVLKVAGLLALVERRSRIMMRHVVKAIALADTWVQCSEVLVSQVCNNGFAKDISEVEQYVASQVNQTVRYQTLLVKFQGRFEDSRRLSEVLDYCQKKGTLVDMVKSKKPEDRYIKYINRA